MSRSYRKPYVSNARSGKEDKTRAHRGERRLIRNTIRQTEDWEDFVMPDRFEAPHNDIYGWSRNWKYLPLTDFGSETIEKLRRK
jgi:hypothetical protein